MGRKKKIHSPIDDSFKNVIDAILKVPVENKRVKKKDKEEETENEDITQK